MWTRPTDLKQQIERLWVRGILPRCLIREGEGLPLRLILKTPNASDLADQFERVRDWVESLRSMTGIRLEWREVRHRLHGLQQLPSAALIDDPDAALVLIGRQREGHRFRQQVQHTQEMLPALLPWLEKKPLEALALYEDWTPLMRLLTWLKTHPKPGVYLRQIDLPGIDTKFIERHRKGVAELLPLLMGEQRDPTGLRAASLERDLGFLEKPVRIRFRPLDPRIELLGKAQLCPDITLDARSFAALALPVSRVFILENEINFLCFPNVEGAIAVFGSGYGWDALSEAVWLKNRSLFYWGDLDTHGFAILNQLRSRFPQVESFLMDRATLIAHETVWGVEKNQTRGELKHLTKEEMALYLALVDGCFGKNVRLEQERIGFRWVTQAVHSLVDAASP